MSLESAHAELSARCLELGEAVTELVTIVHEDRPPGSEIAVVDALTETVSELQAAAVRATDLLAQVADPRSLPTLLARVDSAVDDCRTRYWRDLAAYRPLSALRRAAHEHGREWRAWQRSIELSLGRCEPALGATGAAVRVAWAEVAELVMHYTHARADAAAAWPGSTPSDVSRSPRSTSTRRQS